MEEEKNAKNDTSVMAKLTAKIIDNLQIRIKHVHIRFEDHSSCPGHPFAGGVILEKLHVYSPTEDNEASTPLLPGMMRKKVRVTRFGVYWDFDESSRIHAKSVETLQQEMNYAFADPKNVPADRLGVVPRHWIVEPISLSLRVRVDTRKGGAAQAGDGRGDRERGDGAGRVGADRRDATHHPRVQARAEGRRARTVGGGGVGADGGVHAGEAPRRLQRAVPRHGARLLRALLGPVEPRVADAGGGGRDGPGVCGGGAKAVPRPAAVRRLAEHAEPASQVQAVQAGGVCGAESAEVVAACGEERVLGERAAATEPGLEGVPSSVRGTERPVDRGRE